MPTCECGTRSKSAFITKRGAPTKRCDPCRANGAARTRAHYARDPDAVKRAVKRWQKNNPGAWRAIKRRNSANFLRKNPAYAARKNRRYRQKYPEKGAARASAYRAQKLRATPGWADKAAMEEFFYLARLESKLTGQRVTVDHIVPLKSPRVCGLHCEDNLRLVSHGYNSRKRNHTWPDMP